MTAATAVVLGIPADVRPAINAASTAPMPPGVGATEDTADEEAAHVVSEASANGRGADLDDDAAKEGELDVRLAQRTSRRKANRTDHIGNGGDEDVSQQDAGRVDDSDEHGERQEHWRQRAVTLVDQGVTHVARQP